MKFKELEIPGVFVIDMQPIADERGFFARGWCVREFEDHGLKSSIVQQNFGFNKFKGTLRGMHLQTAPFAEVKIVRCTRGAIYDAIVDLRPDSPTFKQWVGVELTADNHKMLYVPEGFAHGYQALRDETEMYYFTTQFYAPDHATGVRFDDPEFGVDWPIEVAEISDADKAWPAFDKDHPSIKDQPGKKQ